MRSEGVQVLAVVGESQHGKSSFINMLSGSSKKQLVGSGDGRSCTSTFCPVKFQDRFQLFGNSGSQIYCDDIPGFGDTDMSITNRQILETMKPRLAGLERREFDAMLVFQSIAESRIGLLKTFTRIEEIFGQNIIRSSIVIVTKSDMLVEKEVRKKMATISGIASTRNIQVVTWVNDTSDGAVEEEQKQRQIASLRATLMRTTPYTVMNLAEYEHLVAERAKDLMARDVVKKNVAVPTQKVESYMSKETVTVPKVVPRYNEEEIQRKSRIKASQRGNMRAEIAHSTQTMNVETFDVVDELQTVKTKSKLFGVFTINGTAQVVTQKVVTKTVQQQVPTTSLQLVPRDPSEFEDELREQVKVEEVKEEREVEKFRTKTVTENVTLTAARHDDAHYKRQAGKQIAMENWKKNAG